MKYLFDGISLQNGRKTNMDSLLLTSRSVDGVPALLAVVCDGVGSLADGGMASGLAVRMLSQWFQETGDLARIGLRMRDAILGINGEITHQARQQGVNTASTLSALLLAEEHYYVAHVGDSRVYMCDDSGLYLLTRDDVSQSGKLTACIGQSAHITLQYAEGEAAGRAFLVCSDGLYKRMDFGLMAQRMGLDSKRALKEGLRLLTDYVISQGESDNISLALIKAEH